MFGNLKEGVAEKLAELLAPQIMKLLGETVENKKLIVTMEFADKQKDEEK